MVQSVPSYRSKIIPSFFTIKEGSTFLTKPLFPQGREDVTALLGARNRYALRLADHQRSRQIVRDGTALLILACELVMDWGLLACGLLMGLLLYKYW